MTMTTIIQNICKVLKFDVPESEARTLTMVKQASKAQEDVFNRFAGVTRKYLKKVQRDLKDNKGITLPSAEEFEEDPQEEDDSGPVEATASEDEFSIPKGIDCHPIRKNYPIEAIIGKWNRKSIHIPNFQRKFVWSEKRKQALIETILAGLVIPEIMFAAVSSSAPNFCLDGWQRLNTILDFSKDNVKLDPKSEMFAEYGGKVFSELPEELQERFLTYELGVATVIAEKKYWAPIFGRINGGSQKLTAMELRRGLFEDAPVQALFEIFEEIEDQDECFFAMYGYNDHYGGTAALLRAKAMHDNYQNYTKPMDKFLNEYCTTLPHQPEAYLKRLKRDLSAILTMLYLSMGKKAFRLEDGGPINAGMIDCMMHVGFLLTESDLDYQNDLDMVTPIFVKVKERLLESSVKWTFRHDTSGKSSVEQRMSETEVILNEIIKAVKGLKEYKKPKVREKQPA